MSRFSEIAQIYDHRLPQLRSPEVWEQTLRMTSSFWRLNFCEAMLLTLQNPKAEMCGTIDQWNNIGRYIRRGEHSTAVFKSRTDTQLMYLFDVRQTYGKAYNSKWKLSERMTDGIVGKFNSENAENAVSFEDYLQKSLDKNIDIVYNYNSKLNNAISNDPRTAAFIRASAEFICMTRCGIPSDSDFSDVTKINSDLSIVEIGNAATALAQAVLREIDGIIRRKEYERYEVGICGRHLRYPIRGRSERTISPEIHELRQGADDSAGAQGGRPDERTRPDSAGHGEHQRTVPPNLEGNREESRENSEQHNTFSAGENLPQPGLLREREPADGDRHGGAGSRVGIPADERSVAGGGSPEPGESDGDPENLDEPDDEELDEMVSDDKSDTISVFTDIPEEISPDSDYAQKLLEDEIIRGSGFSNGKFRISEYVSENSPGKDELAKFLKNEYGIGGSSRNDDPVSFSNHDGKGIELVLSNRQVIRFNWKKVAEAVRSAVNSGKYITESDIEMRRRMTLFDAQRFAIHYEYPHCLYNDRLDYIRKEIAACGLDYPIRLNVDMFAVYVAECVRTKPHVKESYQKIDRSSIDIPWKFNDWSEAAEAGKNLPVDSGYGQFRAMCRDSVSELMNEISAHTGHNPALGFPEEEITEFFASGEPLTSDSVDKITSEVFGYLYNQEQHSRLSYNNPTEIIALDQPAEQFTLFGDNKFTMEEPPVDELPDESLNRAAAYIKDYFEQEFGSAAEIEDPSHVDLAYTTDEENDAVISVYADLVQYRITTEYGGNIAREEQYNSLDEMNELALKFLSFDDLISLSDEENKANPGTAQAVFCDTNTPKKDAFSVYQALRDRLVRSGEFTENEIAFVHDAANDKQRLAMFEKVNNAEIKIIIGSTGKLGTGVNIQRKLSALHHLDAPYRPSDIEQRNGRGIRQGNENSEVYIGYYSTKGTFDNYRWQILEKKQQIISQIMSGKPAARTCEDIDDTALTFAEMKAATTGNPLIAEKMTVDNEVNRLKLLQANYYQQQRSFEYDISNRYPDLISRKEKMIEWTKKDNELISAAPPITEDNFRMTLGGRTFVERSKAGDELAALVTKYMMSDDYQEYKSRTVGELNDFKIVLMHQGALVSLSLKANGHYTCDYSMSGLGGVTRLCNLYERIPEQIHGLNAELEQAKKQLANAKEQYGKPFQYEEQLRAGLERQAQINAELEVADKPHDEAVMSDYSDDENEEMEM